MIRTMRERWNLGPPLTARDADAADIGPVLTLDTAAGARGLARRHRPPRGTDAEALIPLDEPLNRLAKALVGGLLALGKGLGATVPDVSPDAEITGAQAIAIGHDVLGDLFPSMRS